MLLCQQIDHFSLLQDSTISSALNFFYVFCCDLKEKGQITSNMNNKNKKSLYRKSVLLFGLPKLGSVGPVQQKIKLPSPNIK